MKEVKETLAKFPLFGQGETFIIWDMVRGLNKLSFYDLIVTNHTPDNKTMYN